MPDGPVASCTAIGRPLRKCAGNGSCESRLDDVQRGLTGLCNLARRGPLRAVACRGPTRGRDRWSGPRARQKAVLDVAAHFQHVMTIRSASAQNRFSEPQKK